MAEQPERRRISGDQAAAVVAIVLATVFVFQNTDETEIRFLIPEVSTPLWVALLATLAVGFGAGWVTGRRARRRD